MSNWPPTCNECGAPMIGGRCPRCRYDPRPLGGKITYTAGQPLGGAVGTFPIQFTQLVAAEGPGVTLTIPGVSAPTGNTLFAHVVTIDPAGQGLFPTVTWGGVSMAIKSDGVDQSTFATLNSFILLSTTSAAQSLVITAPAGIDRIGAMVGWMTGNRIEDTNTSVVPATSTSISLVAIAHVDGALATSATYVEGVSAETGTWGSPAVPRLSVAVGGTVQPGFFSLATIEIPTKNIPGGQITFKTLSAAAPWAVDTVVFK